MTFICQIILLNATSLINGKYDKIIQESINSFYIYHFSRYILRKSINVKKNEENVGNNYSYLYASYSLN